MEPAFEDCDAQLTLHFHPSKLRRLGENLALEFDKLLLSYSRDLRAIVLAHSEQRVLGTSLGVDSFLWPYVRVDAAVRLCLYRVVPGQLIGAHPSNACPFHSRNKLLSRPGAVCAHAQALAVRRLTSAPPRASEASAKPPMTPRRLHGAPPAWIFHQRTNRAHQAAWEARNALRLIYACMPLRTPTTHVPRICSSRVLERLHAQMCPAAMHRRALSGAHLWCSGARGQGAALLHAPAALWRHPRDRGAAGHAAALRVLCSGARALQVSAACCLLLAQLTSPRLCV